MVLGLRTYTSSGKAAFVSLKFSEMRVLQHERVCSAASSKVLSDHRVPVVLWVTKPVTYKTHADRFNLHCVFVFKMLLLCDLEPFVRGSHAGSRNHVAERLHETTGSADDITEIFTCATTRPSSNNATTDFMLTSCCCCCGRSDALSVGNSRKKSDVKDHRARSFLLCHVVRCGRRNDSYVPWVPWVLSEVPEPL
jgi:hypothetical protein